MIELRFSLFRLIVLLGAIAACQSGLWAQYQGLNLLGDVGLKSGSQPGPGIYVTIPLFYRADYVGLRNAHGDSIARGLNTTLNIFSAPMLTITTKAKIAGATYGFQVVPLLLNQRLSLADTGAGTNNGYAFNDMYFQPINLGWRTKRADFLAAYGIYAPTGTGSHTLNMWGHELVGGTTVYFDGEKKWHAAATGFFDIYQTKNNTDVRVGDILTVEGGAGRSFLKGAGQAGLVYAARWQITHDSGSDIPARLPITNGRVFGLGAELGLPVFAKGSLVGLVGLRYVREFGARTDYEGNVFVVTFTIAKLDVQ